MARTDLHQWTIEDVRLLQKFGLLYYPALNGFVEKHSRIAHGVDPAISLTEPGYVRAYKVWVVDENGKHSLSRCYKCFGDLPSALMEFARWQGRGDAEQKLRQKLKGIRDLMEGTERYAPV